MVRMEDVHKRFGDNVVLDGIDLSSSSPARCCVSSGRAEAGRAPLLRCVNLLEPIQSGRISLEGEEITRKGVDVSGIRQRIGIVSTSSSTSSRSSRRSTTSPSRRAASAGCLVGRRRSENHELLASVGLAEEDNSIRINSLVASNSESPLRGRS